MACPLCQQLQQHAWVLQRMSMVFQHFHQAQMFQDAVSMTNYADRRVPDLQITSLQ